MFSIGTIGAAGGVPVVVSLTSRTVTVDTYGTFYYYADRAGNLTLVAGAKNKGIETVIPGEWVATGASATVGDAYELMLSSGASYWYNLALINTWLPLATPSVIYAGGPPSGSTFTASIRLASTGQIVATATYTFA